MSINRVMILAPIVMILMILGPDMIVRLVVGYAMKYDTIAANTKTDISPIVSLWSINSPPRRSNLPKSLDPGTIESPFHFAWSITTMMMRIERTKRRVERRDIYYSVKNKTYTQMDIFKSERII